MEEVCKFKFHCHFNYKLTLL